MAFTVIMGETKVGLNTDYISFMSRSKTSSYSRIDIFLNTGSLIQLLFEDIKKRNTAFDTLLTDIASNKVKPSYDFGIATYNTPKTTTEVSISDAVKVQGVLGNAVQITNDFSERTEEVIPFKFYEVVDEDDD